MADNTQVNTGSGDMIRDIDRSSVKTQVVGLDMNPAGAEHLMAAGQGTMANSLPMAIASDQSAVPTLESSPSAATGTWDSSTSTSIVLAVSGYSTVIISGTNSSAAGAATALFEISHDGGTTYVTLPLLETTTTADSAAITTIAGGSFGGGTRAFRAGVSGFTHARVRFSGTLTSGSIAWRITASTAPTWATAMRVFNASLSNLAVSQSVANNLLAQVSNAGTFAVQSAGSVAHDGVATSVNPDLVGGYASAAAPSDVSNDGDSVRAWFLRNGSPVVNLASGGTLIDPRGGDVAHDGVNSGNPVQIGVEAIAHGTNPTAVSASADRTKLYANRAGILFVMGGHPNIVTIEAAYTGAQTDTAIVTVAAGLKIVVTQVQVVTDNANTAFPQCRVGFGTVNTPTTTGVVLTHPGLPAGGGVSRGDGSGILGIGADDQDLRITCGAPTGGSLRVLVSYYTIES